MEDLRMRYTTAALIALIIFIIGFAVGFMTSRRYSPTIELPVVTVQRDTVTVRDTIQGKVQPPVTTIIKRVDTVRIEMKPSETGKFEKDTNTPEAVPDTSTQPRIGQGGEVLIPISSKVYKTNDYRAVISGWRPTLDTIEIYRDTRTITVERTRTKQPWLAIIGGGGVGYTPQKTIVPFAGIGVGIVIKSW